MTETKFCRNCGAEIDEEAVICPQCGVMQQSEKTETQKNEGVAAILSFFFTGLGQIYNGQIGKGIVLIVIQVINIMLMVILVGFITYLIVWIFGMWDAYITAQKINTGMVV